MHTFLWSAKTVKYLGVLIDDNLSRKHHISRLASKISMSVSLISRLRHFVPLNTLHHIYRSLIQPYLLNGIAAWGSETKSYAYRSEPFALCDYKSDAIPLFVSSNLLPLDLLYFKSVAILMHDVFNNLSPPQISNIFNFQSNVHSYNTRSSSRGNFFAQYSRLVKKNKSFSRNGVRVWNSLSAEIRYMSKTTFKRKVHDLLLQKLLKADNYINLLDLITN